MKPLIFIFARKGSKRIKNKNMKKIKGKPLIEYTIQFIEKINLLKSTIVSTDDPKVIKFCKKKKIDDIIIRPKYLTSDNANELQSWKHAIKIIEERKQFDTFICLPVTSPLRTIKEFKAACKVFIKEKTDMVVSICKTNHFPNFNMVQLKEKNRIKILENKKNNSKNYRNSVYNLTTSFYIAKKKFIKKTNFISYEKNKIVGFEVSRKSGLDIDDKYDFEIAKLLI